MCGHMWTADNGNITEPNQREGIQFAKYVSTKDIAIKSRSILRQG